MCVCVCVCVYVCVCMYVCMYVCMCMCDETGAYYTLYTIDYTLYTIHYTLYTIHYTLLTNTNYHVLYLYTTTYKGALMMVDEVQTGMGRTGKMWGHEHFGPGESPI
jgi:hypothetical protein